MSNSLAIAAVTATLRNLLASGVGADADFNDTIVSTQPPDRVRASGSNPNQLNIFLYHTAPNAGFGYAAMPAPLALNLYYLITAYGRDNDVTQPFSHQILGKAMSILHDHSVLLADEIRTALPNNDLYAQLEHVRLTIQPLSLEEILKLWGSFQTHYRLSVAYEASVVIIENNRRSRAPLPVLTVGVTAGAGPVPPFATVESVIPARGERSAHLGDTVSVKGNHLDEGDALVVFKNPRLRNAIRRKPQPGGSPGRMDVSIDDDPVAWIAGLYSVSVEIVENAGTPRERMRTTNDAPLALAPEISSEFPIRYSTGAGSTALELTCKPHAAPGQEISLLLGERAIPAEPVTAPTGQLRFVVTDIPPGDYLARLRVDGIDSLLVDNSGEHPIFKDHRVILS